MPVLILWLLVLPYTFRHRQSLLLFDRAMYEERMDWGRFEPSPQSAAATGLNQTIMSNSSDIPVQIQSYNDPVPSIGPLFRESPSLAQAVGVLCGLAWLVVTLILLRVQLVSGTSRAILASHKKPWLEEWVLTRDDRISGHVAAERGVLRDVSLARIAELQRAAGSDSNTHVAGMTRTHSGNLPALAPASGSGSGTVAGNSSNQRRSRQGAAGAAGGSQAAFTSSRGGGAGPESNSYDALAGGDDEGRFASSTDSEDSMLDSMFSQ